MSREKCAQTDKLKSASDGNEVVLQRNVLKHI